MKRARSVHRDHRKRQPAARAVRERLLRVIEQCELQERKASGLCTHAMQWEAAPPETLRRIFNAEPIVNFCHCGGAAADVRPGEGTRLGQSSWREGTRQWSHWLGRSAAYQSLLMTGTIVNCLCLGFGDEIGSDDAALKALVRTCYFATTCAFCLDIVIKWVSDFKSFWLDPWNIFGACLALLPITSVAYSRIAGISAGIRRGAVARVECFAATRLVCCVGAVAPPSMRTIPRAITRAAVRRSVGLACLLLSLAYAYALVGTTLFEDYAYSTRGDLAYKEAFTDVGASVVTLLRLASLNWFQLYKDMSSILPIYLTAPYIATWIFVSNFTLGSFVPAVLAESVRRARESRLLHKLSAVGNASKTKQKSGSLTAANVALMKLINMKISMAGATNVMEGTCKEGARAAAQPARTEEGGRPAEGATQASQLRSRAGQRSRSNRIQPSNEAAYNAAGSDAEHSLETITDPTWMSEYAALTRDIAAWDSAVAEIILKLSKVDAVTKWRTRDFLNFLAALESLVENLWERTKLVTILNDRVVDMLTTS